MAMAGSIGCSARPPLASSITPSARFWWFVAVPQSPKLTLPAKAAPATILAATAARPLHCCVRYLCAIVDPLAYAPAAQLGIFLALCPVGGQTHDEEPTLSCTACSGG